MGSFELEWQRGAGRWRRRLLAGPKLAGLGGRLGVAVLAGGALAVGAAGQASAAPHAKLMVCQRGCNYATIETAIDAAPDGATIIIAPGVYSGFKVPDTNSRLTRVILAGAGSGRTTITGVRGTLITVARGAVVTIEGVTITGGGSSPGAGAGGIANYGALTLKDSTVTGNHAVARGGGIYNNAVLTLSASTVSCNTPDDIYGSYTASHSTVGGCRVDLAGGPLNPPHPPPVIPAG